MAIKAILFDMDGVLVNAKDWHYEALNRALSDFGYLPIGRAAHLAVYDGLPTRKKLKLLAASQKMDEKLFEDINRVKQAYTHAIARLRCKPCMTLAGMLSKLKSEGYKLGLCSNSVRGSVELMMGQMELAPYFDFMLSYEDVARPKPEPDIYLHAMERLGVSPDEALVLEDNENGITAARRAGAKLLVIGDVSEVTYARVTAAIKECNR